MCEYSVNTITIYGLSGRVVEVEFLKFLRRNGQALENIYIQDVEGDSMSDEWWVSNVAHIYNNHIANAVQFASPRVQALVNNDTETNLISENDRPAIAVADTNCRSMKLDFGRYFVPVKEHQAIPRIFRGDWIP
ncbi:hypothetical protein Tco_1386230 [Tanacetum coccineum]